MNEFYCLIYRLCLPESGNGVKRKRTAYNLLAMKLVIETNMHFLSHGIPEPSVIKCLVICQDERRGRNKDVSRLNRSWEPSANSRL
jgi:hypothetical protein